MWKRDLHVWKETYMYTFQKPEFLTHRDRGPACIEKRPTNGEKRPYKGKKRPTYMEKRPTNGEKRPYKGKKRPTYMEKRPTCIQIRNLGS